jgi:hypothetical protein
LSGCVAARPRVGFQKFSASSIAVERPEIAYRMLISIPASTTGIFNIDPTALDCLLA